MKFRKGQIIELINNQWMNAQIGAKAVVVSQCSSYVNVRWVRGTGAEAQFDGEYYPSMFKLISEAGGVLLFPFMYEKV